VSMWKIASGDQAKRSAIRKTGRFGQFWRT